MTKNELLLQQENDESYYKGFTDALLMTLGRIKSDLKYSDRKATELLTAIKTSLEACLDEQAAIMDSERERIAIQLEGMKD
jgi:hypothetical protein